ncbi:flavin reductase family protein [Rhodococcus sp. X156]|uniref:flavin reductase family protein n=1 Tax=Rhodococcus sp. X156 TaxID=2499145 RepID=UPI000FDA43A3|nr:flavin reductase family protein [Rhodococcus sp. X156]
MTADNDGGAAFETLVGQLNYPMFVVTTAVAGHRSGCLVGFATQVSIEPRRFLVGLSNKNHTYRVAAEATHLAVHVLSPADRELARLFGSTTGDEVDKFADCAWHEGPEGLPILDGATAWFSGRILERLPLGDHVAHLLEPESGSVAEEIGELVTFGDVKDLEPGHDA